MLLEWLRYFVDWIAVNFEITILVASFLFTLATFFILVYDRTEHCQIRITAGQYSSMGNPVEALFITVANIGKSEIYIEKAGILPLFLRDIFPMRFAAKSPTTIKELHGETAFFSTVFHMALPPGRKAVSRISIADIVSHFKIARWKFVILVAVVKSDSGKTHWSISRPFRLSGSKPTSPK